MLALASSEGRTCFFNLQTGTSWTSDSRLEEPVNCLCFSLDKQTLVSGGQDHRVRLWQVATGEEIGILGEHEGAVFAVAFAPDGRHVASGGGSDMAILVGYGIVVYVRSLEGNGALGGR
jgi:WD40 repeat protein